MSLHVIVGAGAVGRSLAMELAEAGHDVRVVTRSGNGPAHPGIQLVKADAADSTALQPHVAGAAALYNCANPPSYQYWEKVWPPLAASLLQVAEATEAVLVIMGNLYGYGPASGPASGPISRDHPLTATHHKGRLRVQMWQEALAAHQAGRVRVTEARASDFIGPGVPAQAGWSTRFGQAALAGKTVYALGDPDAAHSWTFIPDVARTLAVLGTDERAWGQAWHIPSPAPVSPRTLVEETAKLAGVRPPRVRGAGRGTLRLFTPFSALLRELVDVFYQWDRPFVIDAEATTDAFGIRPTRWDDVIRRTVSHWQHGRNLQSSGHRDQTS